MSKLMDDPKIAALVEKAAAKAAKAATSQAVKAVKDAAATAADGTSDKVSKAAIKLVLKDAVANIKALAA